MPRVIPTKVLDDEQDALLAQHGDDHIMDLPTNTKLDPAAPALITPTKEDYQYDDEQCGPWRYKRRLGRFQYVLALGNLFLTTGSCRDQTTCERYHDRSAVPLDQGQAFDGAWFCQPWPANVVIKPIGCGKAQTYTVALGRLHACIDIHIHTLFPIECFSLISC